MIGVLATSPTEMKERIETDSPALYSMGHETTQTANERIDVLFRVLSKLYKSFEKFMQLFGDSGRSNELVRHQSEKYVAWLLLPSLPTIFA